MPFDDSDVEGNLPAPKLKIPSPAKCIDEGEDECVHDGDAIVLCEHHFDRRLADAERGAMKAGVVQEQERIVSLLIAHASREFMAGREEIARTYRDLVTRIKK
jgi:hypothetical protein